MVRVLVVEIVVDTGVRSVHEGVLLVSGGVVDMVVVHFLVVVQVRVVQVRCVVHVVLVPDGVVVQGDFMVHIVMKRDSVLVSDGVMAADVAMVRDVVVMSKGRRGVRGGSVAVERVRVGRTCGLFVLDGRGCLRCRRNITCAGQRSKRGRRCGRRRRRRCGRGRRDVAGFIGLLGHGVLATGIEALLPCPQFLAGQRPPSPGIQPAEGVVNVGRAHCCLPLSEDWAVSAGMARTVSSVPPAPRSTDGGGAVTREPTSAPLAFCMSMAC